MKSVCHCRQIGGIFCVSIWSYYYNNDCAGSDSGYKLTWTMKNVFSRRFLFLISIQVVALVNPLNLFFVLFQIFLICWWNLSLISITPRSFSNLLFMIKESPKSNWVFFGQKWMASVSVSFYLVIRKPLKIFLSRILQSQNDVINAVSFKVNGFIISIASKVYNIT